MADEYTTWQGTASTQQGMPAALSACLQQSIENAAPLVIELLALTVVQVGPQAAMKQVHLLLLLLNE